MFAAPRSIRLVVFRLFCPENFLLLRIRGIIEDSAFRRHMVIEDLNRRGAGRTHPSMLAIFSVKPFLLLQTMSNLCKEDKHVHVYK